MSVKIRLQRFGKKKKPFYRLVVAESALPRDGKIIENVGTYSAVENPTHIELKEERIKYWLSVGAQPTKTVERILGLAKIVEPTKRTSSNQKTSKKDVNEKAAA
jgi:small subunit ribosomal protein S16